jgi:NAD(P)H-flavin reductase
MALLPWQTAVITKIVDVTGNTKRFCFEIADNAVFDFIPGQFVTLDLPIHERASKRLRSYSIASPPAQTNCFELVIVLLDGGAGTSYLFSQGHVGLEVTFRGPLGNFILPETITKDICMVCTGTGIAPFHSMVMHLHRTGWPDADIHLVFGTRTEADILYHRELQELSELEPRFHFHIALSRAKKEEWSGHIGYVHNIYESICDNGRRDMHFYLCGWKNRVDDARTRLADMGYETDHVHLELYG